MAVLDAYGQPLRPARLRQEIAGPTVTGLRSIWSEHPAAGLTPGRLAVILREAEQGDARAFLDLAEEMEERDLHYLAVLSTRRRQVSQLNVTVEPADDSPEAEADAAEVRAWVERTELEDEMFSLLDAVSKGYAVAEIMWETSARQWQPARIEYRLPRWFEFDRESGMQLLLRSDIRAGGVPDGAPGLVPLEPGKFVTHFHQAKSGLPIRGGLARAAAWAWLFKNYTTRDWVRFVEAYGQPLRLGRFHKGATPAERDVLLRAVRNIATDACGIVPEGMNVEFVTAKAGTVSSALYADLLGYLDAQVSKAVLGQTLTTDAGKGGSGSYALGKVHDEVRHDIERSDARQLAATLTRDVARPIVALNRGDPGARGYPRIVIGREEQIDLAMLADAVSKLVLVGLKVDAVDLRARMGLPDPAPGAEILTRMPPADGAAAPAEQATARARRARASAARGDAFDRAVDDLIDGEGWAPLMEPVIGPVLAASAGSDDLDEVRARLARLMGDMDDATFIETLRRMGFSARLSGAAGLTGTNNSEDVT
ncbi:DUF935 domain-containing protein [Ruegeria sp.]|uniref:DUF935 domain-containing protein n=1 Tax=Ruegeria sp. TaxID=1879320 RepID=UPI003B59CFC6